MIPLLPKQLKECPGGEDLLRTQTLDLWVIGGNKAILYMILMSLSHVLHSCDSLCAVLPPAVPSPTSLPAKFLVLHDPYHLPSPL